MKLKKGDNAIVIAGKDKGKIAKILRAFPSRSQVLLEGLNMKKKHMKSRKQGAPGQIIEKAMPMHISNVSLVDPKTKKATRVGFEIKKDKKVRIAKKSGSEVTA